ncbi:MAG: hypothetical protein OEY41_17535 [Acidimicrobiia bacterium]|nr:hypothetical protein [Acidimicrobiia bacterium]
MLSRRRPHPPADTERGSVILSVLVLLVASLLAALAFATARRSLAQGAQAADQGRADATAEIGVYEAFARIDQAATAAFTGSGQAGGVGYSYRADLVTPNQWTIRSEATSGPITRALTATVGRDTRYPYTLFVDERLVSDQNRGRIAGRVGTNGTALVTGRPVGDQQDLFTPSGTCDHCNHPATLDGPRKLEPVTMPVGVPPNCPEGGLFLGVVDGRSGQPVVCDDPALPVVFQGDVTIVNPPLVVYVGRSVPLTLDGATVNRLGKAANVQLYVAGDATDAESRVLAERANLTVLLFAPGRSMALDTADLTGSLTIRVLEIAQRGRVDVTDDPSVAPLNGGPWRLVDLRPVGSGR